MEFDSVIDKRHSCRSFKNKKASWKDVLEAIDSTSKNPFADNRNNVKFIIIEKQEIINKIAELSGQLWINESGILAIVCSDDSNLENMHGERGRVYSRQQAGAVIQTFLLKLTDLRLNSCWVGAFKDEMIKQLLKIPQHIQIEAIIPIGYTKEKIEKKKKKALENLIYWEEWEQNRKKPLIGE